MVVAGAMLGLSVVVGVDAGGWVWLSVARDPCHSDDTAFSHVFKNQSPIKAARQALVQIVMKAKWLKEKEWEK